MKIPKKVKVGKTWYTVQKRATPALDCTKGSVSYKARTIFLALKGTYGGKFTKKEQYNTFWHELTHAILEDMGSVLESNERFVTSFADRLTNAITTAKL